MKKILRGIFLVLLAGAAAAPAFAMAAPGGEVIHNFNVTARVDKSSQVWIDETIDYDFGDLERHGIFRNIPIKYKTEYGGNQTLRISNIHVADNYGKAYKFTTSYSGSDLVIKIGDPDVTISGAHKYIISYTVEKALGYFKDFDEFYWNATGNGWDVPIESSTASIYLPEAIAKSDARIACYTGYVGDTQGCRIMVNDVEGKIGHVYFSNFGTLQPKQGLTVAVGFPKGLVAEPTVEQKILEFIRDNWAVAVPFIVFAFMFNLWWRKGKDPKGRGTIVPEYDAPDNLTPLEMSALRNQGMRPKDISAGIVSLAVQGYIKIEKIEKKVLLFPVTDYKLIKLKEPDEKLDPAMTFLLHSLFVSVREVELSDLKNKFYTNIPALKNLTMKAVIEKGFYVEEPSKTMLRYTKYSATFIIIMFVLAYFNFMNAVTAVSLIASGLIVTVFSHFMPKVTALGAVMKERIDGLKMYINVAEKDRINFHNAPAKNPELFEKLLPYAMVLGAEEAWAKQFEGILTTQPNWYNDTHMGAFNAALFAHNISGFSSAAVSSLSTAPGSRAGSGGGGFSGGGGGGGGGGSW